MTKQHFEAIARELRDLRSYWLAHDDVAVEAIDDGIERLAFLFSVENPRFDRDRFLRAAGVLS